MKIASFAGLSVAVFVVLAIGLLLVFPGEAERQAVAVSATLALAVQIVAFALLWRLRRRHLVAAWSLGMTMRFATIVLAALLLVPRWRLPATAMLCSLVLFFFVSTLLETCVLRS